MLMITFFANPRVAQAFVDYMATQGVILTIQQHDQSDVWLADESPGRARTGGAGAPFSRKPGRCRYLAASWQAGHTGSGLHYRRYPFFAALRERARRSGNLGGDDRLRGGVYRHANSRRSGSDVMAGLAIRSNTEI
ncbi:hypothetical protein ACLB1T_09360 [Escherichia coli]